MMENVRTGHAAPVPSADIMLPAEPEALSFRPRETALIVVDMQNAYASPGGYIDIQGFDVSGAKLVIERILRVIATARALGSPIIFFQNGWEPARHEAGTPDSPNWWKSNALKLMRAHPKLDGQAQLARVAPVLRGARRLASAARSAEEWRLSRSCAYPWMLVRGLLSSWAIPETSWPKAAIFSVCMSLDWISLWPVMSR